MRGSFSQPRLSRVSFAADGTHRSQTPPRTAPSPGLAQGSLLGARLAPSGSQGSLLSKVDFSRCLSSAPTSLGSVASRAKNASSSGRAGSAGLPGLPPVEAALQQRDALRTASQQQHEAASKPSGQGWGSLAGGGNTGWKRASVSLSAGALQTYLEEQRRKEFAEKEKGFKVAVHGSHSAVALSTASVLPSHSGRRRSLSLCCRWRWGTRETRGHVENTRTSKCTSRRRTSSCLTATSSIASAPSCALVTANSTRPSPTRATHCASRPTAQSTTSPSPSRRSAKRC
jgi:hypothetical protein